MCACPPEGTEARFHRCQLPRPGARGLRDEVDLTVVRDNVCMLIECKGLLSDSVQIRNRLGENDFDKLARLKAEWSPLELFLILQRAYGRAPSFTRVETVIAVGSVDITLPAPSSAILVVRGSQTEFISGPPDLGPLLTQ